MTHAEIYLRETAEIAANIDHDAIERMANSLYYFYGKLYIIGLGGSMANAIHMAADLRKLCDVDAEAFDNIAEITARANDDGFDTIFVDWLSKSNSRDGLFILSVGGGRPQVSQAICKAIDKAKENGAKIFGIVGAEGGYTAEKADICIKVPAKEHITPHTEAFQAVIWHLLVSHPLLQKHATKW